MALAISKRALAGKEAVEFVEVYLAGNPRLKAKVQLLKF